MVIIKVMGLSTGPAAHLRDSVSAHTYNILGDFRRLFLYFKFFLRNIIFLRSIELDLAAFGAAVNLHIQCSGNDVWPITKERARLPQLYFFLLYKMQGVPTSGTFDLSHC